MYSFSIINGEEWRPVRGFSGYIVSSFGRVASEWSNAGKRTGTFRLLKQRLSRRYWTVTLYKSRCPFATPVHLLVLTTFVCPRPKRLLGLHKDDDVNNNRAANLYWGTHQQNAKDRVRNGSQFDNRGSKHPLAKLNEQKVRRIKARLRGAESCSAIARDVGVCRETIRDIREEKIWKHV